MTAPGAAANEETILAWNSVLFEKFTRLRKTVTTGFSGHSTVAFEHHPPKKGGRVLDIACGFGDTTFALAKMVGPGGETSGVDAASRFIESCVNEAARDGVAGVRFFVADVEREPLGGPYDLAYSRFGMMFFASPVAALQNIRSSLRPGGKLVMTVWRKKDENEMFFVPESRVLEILPHPNKGEQVTCGPGPFSMASPDVVSTQLVKAGFSRPTFERVDVDIRLGDSLDEAIDFALTMGPAGEVMRLSGDAGIEQKPAIVAALQSTLAPWVRDGGVYGKSSSWLVTAVA